jgi:BirA family biotin operon repressor/biotin-[acetyl-CoA-carboxylase] ligase
VVTGFLSRQQRFDAVGSTNDVVRAWLAEGTPEVCLAVADEQTAGRGRAGRSWVAPVGRALLLSLGFRPSWLAPDRTWRLAAITALAMADAAEEVAGLADGAIRLKWPNDLVVEDEPDGSAATSTGGVRKSVVATLKVAQKTPACP